ncbi:MAG: hypothetical protein ACTHMS_11685 [Jatrophihabitans sp.]|uniref:hypothetical protein n=1 Tax=Jatrophihabitans sp. TaxID=1932789 RepID=UPI003F7E0D8D
MTTPLDGTDGIPAADLDPTPWSPLDAIESSLGMLPARQHVHAPRWLAPLAVSALVGMIPWLVYLGFTLPSKVRSDNYDVAWLGFDSGLMLVLGVLGFAAWRRSAATGALAAVAAMMLVVDAWFDITTSAASDTWLAVVLAACGELPLAAICGWAAYAAERHRARSYQRLCQRWQHAVEAAREAAAGGGEAALRAVSRPPAVPPSR